MRAVNGKLIIQLEWPKKWRVVSVKVQSIYSSDVMVVDCHDSLSAMDGLKWPLSYKEMCDLKVLTTSLLT